MNNDKTIFSMDYFGNSVPNVFGQHWKKEDFTDVTLATMDNMQIKAHKVIISSCSSFFRNLLLKIPHHNLVIYLKDIKYKELGMIMKFIYTGECDVGNLEIPDFLAAGKDLQIDGLMEHTDRNYMAESRVKNKIKKKGHKLEKEDEHTFEVNSELETPSQEELKLMTSGQQEVVENIDGTEYNTVYDSQDEFPHNRLSKQDVPHTQTDLTRYSCNQCVYKAKQKCNLIEHVKSVHEGVRYSCEKCNYKTSKKGNLKIHFKTKHEGARYYCDQCDYKAIRKVNLTYHIQSKHEGVGIKIACDKCEYTSNNKRSLYEHKQFVHIGVRYFCDQCEYIASKKTRLTLHMNSVHERVKYDCDQCDYKASALSIIKRHVQSTHKGVRYCCEKCDYIAKEQRTLTQHIQNIHYGVKYDCNLCEYKSTQKNNLVKHKKTQHKELITKTNE